MKQFIALALGAAFGTLLYTRFLSDVHELDWARAAFVGLFSALCSIIFSATGFRKKRE